MIRRLPIFLTIVFLLALPVAAQSPTQQATQWLESDAKKADAQKPVELPPSKSAAKPAAEMERPTLRQLAAERGFEYKYDKFEDAHFVSSGFFDVVSGGRWNISYDSREKERAIFLFVGYRINSTYGTTGIFLADDQRLKFPDLKIGIRDFACFIPINDLIQIGNASEAALKAGLVELTFSAQQKEQFLKLAEIMKEQLK